MADLSDVEIALTAIITQTVYPDGALFAPIAAVGGALVDIRRGWPIPAMLDTALASGNDVLVRIYPETGMTRNTSRFTLQWRAMTETAPTLTATIAGSNVTFGGTGDPSQAAGILVGAPPNAKTYAYRLAIGDGPAEVAQAFKLLIGGGTNAIGPELTLVTNQLVQARVVHDQSQFLETRRQDQGFRVSIWSANNLARDAVAAAIDSALANLLDVNGNPTMNIILPDNSGGWLRYRSTYDTDQAEKAGLYRRDLCYLIEYPTSLVSTFSSMMFAQTALQIQLCPAPEQIISSSALAG